MTPMKSVVVALCALGLLSALLVGCKPKEPPSSGSMGAVAGKVKDQAVGAAGKVNKVRGDQQGLAEGKDGE